MDVSGIEAVRTVVGKNGGVGLLLEVFLKGV